MTQQRVQKSKIKRIDECAQEFEDHEHAERLSRARRASKKAQQSVQDAAALTAEINDVLRYRWYDRMDHISL